MNEDFQLKMIKNLKVAWQASSARESDTLSI
jgi:hypothetical protein